MLLSKGALIKAESGQECGRLEGFEYHHDLPCAFSSDSRLVASDSVRHEPRLVCPGGVRIWEAATGKAVAHLKTPSWVTQLVFSPDNRLLATNALDGIKLWDLATGQVVFRREMPEKVRSRITSGTYAGCLAFSPDGRRLATGHPDSTILIWEVILPARNPVSARPRELEALWADLSEKDAARAWQAVWRMGELPKETIPFLGQRVQPLRPTPEEVTRPLLAQLDDDSYQRREAATKRLKDLGHQAGPALSTALKGDPTPEKKQRLEMLLQVLAEAPAFSSPKELQELRAVAVLERVDSPEARALLQELAKGIPSAPLTRHAQAAQKRSH
jgi:hypothetical protein